MISKIWPWLMAKWEAAWDPQRDIPPITMEHMVDLNARASRNVWYDKKGNRWPLRDSL